MEHETPPSETPTDPTLDAPSPASVDSAPTPPSITLQCATCGVEYAHSPSRKGGRPPRHCPLHRKQRGEERDPEGNKARKNAARRAQAKKPDSLGMAISGLAAGLSIFPEASSAAAWAGLDITGEELDMLEDQARARHPGVVDGDPSEMSRRCRATMLLLLDAVVANRHLIPPKDLAHNIQALGRVHALGSNEPRYSEMTLEVVSTPPSEVQKS